jgi:hypothetical protein
MNSPNNCALEGDSALANKICNQDDVAGVHSEAVPQHQAKEKRHQKKGNPTSCQYPCDHLN